MPNNKNNNEIRAIEMFLPHPKHESINPLLFNELKVSLM
jgi:hypothetical protein